MQRLPLPILIFSILAVVNGASSVVLGAATLLGSRMLYTPAGYGPNRIAFAEIFGPLAPFAGYIFLALGIVFVSVGLGLFRLKNWSRLIVMWAMGVIAVLTVGAVVWGVYHLEYGVIISGLIKIAIEGAVCFYFCSPPVRKVFGR
jgi:hypothetical protein